MAAFDYIESRDDADELIQEFGQAAYVRRTANSGTEWAPTQSGPTDYATYAAEIEFNAQWRADSDIEAHDQRIIVAAGPLATLGFIVPTPADALVVNGVTLQIVKVKRLKPAGTDVFFDCQVRV